jgi:hypothetical protein
LGFLSFFKDSKVLKKEFFYYYFMVFSVFANSPKNHHYILDFLKPMPQTSLIRVDNHEDLIRSGFGYSLPCARYMNAVFNNEYFENVFWIRKNLMYSLRAYNKNEQGMYFFKDYSLDNLQGILDIVKDNSFEKIVLDIDPDILCDYETGFSKGSMQKYELKNLINYFKKNKKVELFFLAESEKFLTELLENPGYCIKQELYSNSEH